MRMSSTKPYKTTQKHAYENVAFIQLKWKNHHNLVLILGINLIHVFAPRRLFASNENSFVYLDLNKHILQSSGYKIEAGDFRYGSTLLFLILYLDVLTNSLIYE